MRSKRGTKGQIAAVMLVVVGMAGCGGDEGPGPAELYGGQRARAVAQSPVALTRGEHCTQLSLQDTGQARWGFRGASSLRASEIRSRFVAARYREADVRFQLEDAADLYRDPAGRYYVETYELVSRDGQEVVGTAMLMEAAPVAFVVSTGTAQEPRPDGGQRGLFAALFYLGAAATVPRETEPCRRVTAIDGLSPGVCVWLDGRAGAHCF